MATQPPATSTRRTILSLRGITKTFGAVAALTDVDLDVAEGQVVAVVGDNGAGKATLVEVLSGVHAPDAGTIAFEGDDVVIRTPADAQDLGIATVYQDLALCENLNVVENLFLGQWLRRNRLDEVAMEVRSWELLRELSAKIPTVRIPIASLSGGQRRTVAIARSLLGDPKIIILDEPTAALGVAQTAEVLNLIERLRERGHGVIMISHNIADVKAVADTVVVLRLGRNNGVFEVADVSQEDIIAAITGATDNVVSKRAARRVPAAERSARHDRPGHEARRRVRRDRSAGRAQGGARTAHRRRAPRPRRRPRDPAGRRRPDPHRDRLQLPELDLPLEREPLQPAAGVRAGRCHRARHRVRAARRRDRPVRRLGQRALRRAAAVLWVDTGLPAWLSVVLAMAAGAAIGLVYAQLFNRVGVPSFVITLAGRLAFVGVQLWLLGEKGAVNLPFDSEIVKFARLQFVPGWLSYVLVLAGAAGLFVTGYGRAQDRRKAGLSAQSVTVLAIRSVVMVVVLGAFVAYLNDARGVGWMFVFFVALVLVMNYVLTRTAFGRSMVAVGGNPEAARRAGINVRRIYTMVFVMCSTFAAVGGVLAASCLAAANQQSGGADVNLNAIAAAVIGGTSLFGGRGSAFAALLGILVIQSISNGLTLLSLDSSYRFMITGGVLLLAVSLDSVARRSRVSHGRA